MNAKAPVMNASEFFPCCIFITCSQILIISYTFYGAYSIGDTRHSFYNHGVYNLMLCIIYYCLELKCEGSWRCLPRSPYELRSIRLFSFPLHGFLLKQLVHFLPLIPCLAWSLHSLADAFGNVHIPLECDHQRHLILTHGSLHCYTGGVM